MNKHNKYLIYTPTPVLFGVMLFFITLVLMYFSLTTGPAEISPADTFQALISDEAAYHAIIWNLRVPRMFYAVCVGAGLSLCGLALQGLFRNPLADPFTIGISGGAAFGAAFAVMLLGISSGGLTISFAAFCGAMLSCFIIFLLSERALFSNTALILGGVMIGYFFQSGLMAAISLSTSQSAHNVIVWLMGDLQAAPKDLLWPTMLLTLIGSIFLFRRAKGLNVLTMGDEKALSLGENVKHIRRDVFIWSSVVTGACVAAVGIVGFVGLMVPHLVRRIVGPNHLVLFPLCALAGAAFILLCDLGSRWIFSSTEMALPLGVITGIVGSLMFIWIFVVYQTKR